MALSSGISVRILRGAKRSLLVNGEGRARLTGCRKMEEREATKWVNETRINNQSREEALSQLLLAFVQRGPLQLVDPVCYILII